MHKLIEITRHGHTVIGRRFTRGTNPQSNTPLVGYQLTCTCGWERKSNEAKRQSESYAREHLHHEHSHD